MAVASLMRTVKCGDLPSDAVVMLNITGGGEERFKAEHELFYLKPVVILKADAAVEEVKKQLKNSHGQQLIVDGWLMVKLL